MQSASRRTLSLVCHLSLSRHTSPTHVDPNSDTDAYGHASINHSTLKWWDASNE